MAGKFLLLLGASVVTAWEGIGVILVLEAWGQRCDSCWGVGGVW